MTNWKKKLDKELGSGVEAGRLWWFKRIETEIIEKLIEDVEKCGVVIHKLESHDDGLHIIVPDITAKRMDLMDGTRLQQLKAKWLGEGK